ESCGWFCSRANGDVDLYLRYGDKPTTSSSHFSETGSGNNHTITVSEPKAGTWWIGAYNSHNNYDADNIDMDARASSTAYKTPTGRTVAQEMANFAIWYSYHRTRMKVAKYAASEAFSQLGDNYRDGYDPIWKRKQSVPSIDSVPWNSYGPAYPNPTGVYVGMYKSDNRAKSFEFLQKAQGNNG